MEIDLIKEIVNLPIIAVLIYLMVRQQAQIDKLLASVIESERNHAKDLVEIVCSGKIKSDLIPATGQNFKSSDPT